MKNLSCFVISFFVFGALTFGLSKTNQKDKLGDAVLVGILMGGISTYVYRAYQYATEEEEYIDNNTTQLKVSQSPKKSAADKFFHPKGKNYSVPPQGDDSTIFDDVTETGFFAERDSKVHGNAKDSKDKKY